MATLETRGFVQQCTDREGLARELATRPVTFYVGLDPTAGSLHAGHMIPIYAAAHLARAGHKPIILIGGGTAQIGDPSGKTEMRRMLTTEQIDENAARIERQIRRFLATQGVEAIFVNNARWLRGLNYIEFLRDIGRHFSVNRMLSFESYKIRLESGLSFIEFNYQLLQSFDFLTLYRDYGCELQIGGDDQWGNIVAGADLIRRVEGGVTFGLTFPLVTRADGKKMGKSEEGAVFLDPQLFSPYDFFQYWRNVPDADVEKLLLLYTFLPVEECRRLGSLPGEEINHAKEVLAKELTTLVHGPEEAKRVLDAARAAFQGGTAAAGSAEAIPETPVPGPSLSAGIAAVDLFSMTGLCTSKGEARRLIQQGGARVNERKVESIDTVIDDGWLEDGVLLLRAGKKRYHRVRPEGT
ncbi:MAG: tyrosine--tRNA ligase [bacterium]